MHHAFYGVYIHFKSSSARLVIMVAMSIAVTMPNAQLSMSRTERIAILDKFDKSGNIALMNAVRVHLLWPSTTAASSSHMAMNIVRRMECIARPRQQHAVAAMAVSAGTKWSDAYGLVEQLVTFHICIACIHQSINQSITSIVLGANRGPTDCQCQEKYLWKQNNQMSNNEPIRWWSLSKGIRQCNVFGPHDTFLHQHVCL